MTALVSLLITLIILGLVLWLFWWVINQIPAPPPINTVIRVVFALLCLVAVISVLFAGWTFPLAGHPIIR